VVVDKLAIQDGEQPGAQVTVRAFIGNAAEGSLQAVLHQVVGIAGMTGQRQGEAPQARDQFTQLLIK
jgi:hypothetical protein